LTAAHTGALQHQSPFQFKPFNHLISRQLHLSFFLSSMSRAISGHSSSETTTTQSQTQTQTQSHSLSRHPKPSDSDPLDSSSHSSSTLDAALLQTSKFNHAVDALSSEMSRLTTDLVTETGHRIQLIALLHRQSAALSYCEHHLLNESRPASSTPPDLIALLKSSFTRSFGRTELGNAIFPILNDPTLELPAKIPKLFETLKCQFDRQTTQISNSKRRLTIYLSNLLRFLEQLANSRDIQSWFIDSHHEEDYRPLLLAQVGKIDNL
jgi:hypothetical protein